MNSEISMLVWVVVMAMLISGRGNSQKPKTYKVGVLSGLDAFSSTVDGFKTKMTELGYVEGQNISYDVQSTNDDIDAYKSITKKFVESEVDKGTCFTLSLPLMQNKPVKVPGYELGSDQIKFGDQEVQHVQEK